VKLDREAGALRKAEGVGRGRLQARLPRHPRADPLRILTLAVDEHERAAQHAAIARSDGDPRHAPQPRQLRVDDDATDHVFFERRHVLRRKGQVEVRRVVAGRLGRARQIAIVAARHAAVEPGENRRRLARRERELVLQPRMAARGAPRRHPLFDDFLPNRTAPLAHLAVGRQRHREAVSAVTRRAFAIEDAHDLAGVAHAARDRIVRPQRDCRE